VVTVSRNERPGELTGGQRLVVATVAKSRELPPRRLLPFVVVRRRPYARNCRHLLGGLAAAVSPAGSARKSGGTAVRVRAAAFIALFVCSRVLSRPGNGAVGQNIQFWSAWGVVSPGRARLRIAAEISPVSMNGSITQGSLSWSLDSAEQHNMCETAPPALLSRLPEAFAFMDSERSVAGM